MLALVMSLLVVGVAGVVLRDALRDGTAKRATTGPRTGRARAQRPPRPAPQPQPQVQPQVRRQAASQPQSHPQPPRRPARRHRSHPVRSSLTLLASSVGIGLLLAAAGALLVGAVALALRPAVEGG